MRSDVLIIGAGAAGLFTALHLPSDSDVVVVDKARGVDAGGGGSSRWAQGGIAAALGHDDSPALHAQDTARVAAGHADESAVAVLCSEAPECVLELAELGCSFDRTDAGELHLAREGGQSVPRSVHSADATGAAVMQTLREKVAPRVTPVPGTCLSLGISDGRCVGAWILTSEGLVEIQASSTVLATGGVGRLFNSTTNPAGASGDGIALAWAAGAGLADLEFVQFHPTSLAADGDSQRVLLTEALRGAGAYIVDREGRRFIFEHHSDGELAPRDVVSRAVASRPSWLDCRHLGPELLEHEFRTVVSACRSLGLDPAGDLLPITPAAHYMIGGIQTDLDGRASIPRLYAVGECSNTGAHGANRLAGNSLAEALVFGRRAARAIGAQRVGPVKTMPPHPPLGAAVDTRAIWETVRETCSRALWITRDRRGLASAVRKLDSLGPVSLAADADAIEARAACITSRLMVRAALLRAETRGVHHRSDHEHPEAAWAGVRLRLVKA